MLGSLRRIQLTKGMPKMANTPKIKVSLDSFTMEEMAAFMTGKITAEKYFAFLDRAVVGGTKKLPFSVLPDIKQHLWEEIRRVSKGKGGETAAGNS